MCRSFIFAVIYKFFTQLAQQLVLFTVLLNALMRFCYYLHGFCISTCVFAVICNDVERHNAFLLLFTMFLSSVSPSGGAGWEPYVKRKGPYVERKGAVDRLRKNIFLIPYFFNPGGGLGWTLTLIAEGRFYGTNDLLSNNEHDGLRNNVCGTFVF